MSKYQILKAGGVFDLASRTVIRPDNSAAPWQAYQDWLTAGNSPLPPDSVGADDLPTSKANRKSEINAYAAGLRNKNARGKSAAELATWPLYYTEAKGWLASAAACPTITAIATIRGVGKTAAANVIVAQVDAFMAQEGQIEGVRGKHCDAVDACTTVAQIVTYDWMAGWPA